MPSSIGPRFTFKGHIPDDSDKIHIGIVLNAKEPILKYCYGTSKQKKIINGDFVTIKKEEMALYFKDPKETYIYISEQHIIDILIITFISRLESEYDVLEPIDTNIYVRILNRIENSDNLSDRFKKEFFEFMG